jgi:hypothetical protein
LLAWDAVALGVAAATPDRRLPDFLSISGAVGKTEIAGERGNIRKGSFSRPASNWRVRLNDDRGVLDVLSEAFDAKTHPDPPKLDTLISRRRAENKAWEVPAGFIRVGDFASERGIPRSTISGWQKKDEPKEARDPQSNEVCLPVDWLNKRMTRYQSRPRPKI